MMILREPAASTRAGSKEESGISVAPSICAREFIGLAHVDQHGFAAIQQFFGGCGVDLFDGVGHLSTLA